MRIQFCRISMQCVAWRVLQRLALIRATALPSRSIIYFARRQPPLDLRHPLRNQSTIGAVLCGGKINGWATATAENSMAETEQQQPRQEPPEPVSSCTEAVGASEEEREKAKVSENAQDENQNVEGSGSVAPRDVDAEAEGCDREGGSDVDPAKTATEEGKDGEMHIGSNDTAETVSSGAGTVSSGAEMVSSGAGTVSSGAGTKKDVAGVKVVEIKDDHDQTPPPEEEDEPRGQRLSAAAANNPPKQAASGGGGGGIRGFFSMRRWFSQEPRRDRQYYESLSLEEKRKLYTCGRDFITLDKIETWEEFRGKQQFSKYKPPPSQYPHNAILNEKISLWRGDITKLEIDAIVNAANSSLLGGGGVDGAIHRAASYSLKEECATLNGCETGDAKLTSGHRLPARYVVHTVGPINGSEARLRSCYQRCLQLVLENNIRSIAFCCIATGIYGYPNEDAAKVALETTRNWLESHADKVDRIIFCVFLKIDYKIYSELLHYYFPSEETGAKEREEERERAAATEGGKGEKEGAADMEGGKEEKEGAADMEGGKEEKEGAAATEGGKAEKAAAESEAMEAQDGGSPTATGAKEKLPPSKSDEIVMVEMEDVPDLPIPTLHKSITEPAQRVALNPESDQKIKAREPSPVVNSNDEAGDEGQATGPSVDSGAGAGGEERMEVGQHGSSPNNKRPKVE